MWKAIRMLDKELALQFLFDVLWDEEFGAFRESYDPEYLERFWYSDNSLAWILMQRYDKEKAKRIEENFTKMMGYPPPFPHFGWDRWCVLVGDTESFTQAFLKPNFENWMCYSDLLSLQYLYYHYTGNIEWKNRVYAMLLSQLTEEGLIVDRTSLEPPLPDGCAPYKLSLLAIVSILHNRYDIAKRCLDHIGDAQVKDKNRIDYGGVRIAIWKSEWGPVPDHLISSVTNDIRCNCETQVLSILAQDAYDDATWIKNLPSIPLIILALETGRKTGLSGKALSF